MASFLFVWNTSALRLFGLMITSDTIIGTWSGWRISLLAYPRPDVKTLLGTSLTVVPHTPGRPSISVGVVAVVAVVVAAGVEVADTVAVGPLPTIQPKPSAC
jgi:hypothetical protein